MDNSHRTFAKQREKVRKLFSMAPRTTIKIESEILKKPLSPIYNRFSTHIQKKK